MCSIHSLSVTIACVFTIDQWIDLSAVNIKETACFEYTVQSLQVFYFERNVVWQLRSASLWFDFSQDPTQHLLRTTMKSIVVLKVMAIWWSNIWCFARKGNGSKWIYFFSFYLISCQVKFYWSLEKLWSAITETSLQLAYSILIFINIYWL